MNEITATVGTPTPPSKFRTIYAVQEPGSTCLWVTAARREDAEEALRVSPGSRLVTIPGEDAAPTPADRLAEAVEQASKKLWMEAGIMDALAAYRAAKEGR